MWLPRDLQYRCWAVKMSTSTVLTDFTIYCHRHYISAHSASLSLFSVIFVHLSNGFPLTFLLSHTKLRLVLLNLNLQLLYSCYTSGFTWILNCCLSPACLPALPSGFVYLYGVPSWCRTLSASSCHHMIRKLALRSPWRRAQSIVHQRLSTVQVNAIINSEFLSFFSGKKKEFLYNNLMPFSRHRLFTYIDIWRT